MKTQIKLLAILLAISVSFNACKKDNVTTNDQNTDKQEASYKLGAKLLPANEYNAIAMTEADKDFNLKALPTSVNLKTPPIRHQGNEGSCVAWGTTYAGRSVTYNTTGATYSNYTNIFSPEYVYNQIKAGDCESGSYVTYGLNLLVNQGVCLWADMPYTDYECYTQPNASQKAKAANYKISTYKRVSIDVASMKAQLAAGKIIVVAGPVNSAYENLGYNRKLTSFSGYSLGGHCYAVVGYSDTNNAFKVMNSWGTTWGTNGYGWIDYRYIAQWFQEAYVMYN